MPEKIVCSIKARRLRLGWTQEELARKIQVRRQAVYDMESGRYLPNTAVALRLAGIFACRVEELFSPEPTPGAEIRPAAIPAKTSGTAARIAPPGSGDDTLLIFGCNPALMALDAHIRRRMPAANAHCFFASSTRALHALAQGEAHAAAVHFHGGKGDANVDAARKALAGTGGILIGFSVNEEGILVAPGNPLGIRSVADLAGSGARFRNREPGAAIRKLLDARLREEGVPAEAVTGYEDCARTHDEGALAVAGGQADAALGLGISARTFGLDFVPLAVTRCDLVIPDGQLEHPAVGVLLDVLHSADLRRDVGVLPGFDAAWTGRTVARFP